MIYCTVDSVHCLAGIYLSDIGRKEILGYDDYLGRYKWYHQYSSKAIFSLYETNAISFNHRINPDTYEYLYEIRE